MNSSSGLTLARGRFVLGLWDPLALPSIRAAHPLEPRLRAWHSQAIACPVFPPIWDDRPAFDQCGGKQSSRRHDGAVAQALPRHVPAQRARRMPGGFGAARILPRPGDGSEGQYLSQSGRRAAQNLEGRAARGRRRPVEMANRARRHKARCAPGTLRLVRREHPLREG
jgi:hypothetical protein